MCIRDSWCMAYGWVSVWVYYRPHWHTSLSTGAASLPSKNKSARQCPRCRAVKLSSKHKSGRLFFVFDATGRIISAHPTGGAGYLTPSPPLNAILVHLLKRTQGTVESRPPSVIENQTQGTVESCSLTLAMLNRTNGTVESLSLIHI